MSNHSLLARGIFFAAKHLFAGHVVSSRPMKREEKIHRMIGRFIRKTADCRRVMAIAMSLAVIGCIRKVPCTIKSDNYIETKKLLEGMSKSKHGSHLKC